MAFDPPRKPGQDRRGSSDPGLTRHYLWLLLLIGLPLVMLVILLAVNEYRNQRIRVLNDMTQASASATMGLQTIARLANEHVLRLRDWTSDYFSDRRERPSRLRPYLTPRFTAGQPDGFTLDQIPGEQRSLGGQLFWFGSDPLATQEQRVRLDQALDLFGLAKLTHAHSSSFQWSYFFSADRDYVSMYPWVKSDDVIEGQGHSSLKTSIPEWFDYEIYSKGLPRANPERRLYWTDAYKDAGGTGAMVSLGAPVYVHDTFVGVVGTDVRLATLDRFLAQLPSKIGRFWIVDGRDMLLADSASASNNAIEKVTARLPAGLTLADIEAAHQKGGQPFAKAGYTLIARTTAHAPWTLLYVVSDSEVGALLLPHFLPYAILLLALAVTLPIALFVLQRELISPALQLVRYIQRVSRDPAAQEPELPRLWTTWVKVVSRTFAANRAAHQKLKESEAFKAAIVDNAILAVVTIDTSGCIVEFNPAAEAIFGHRLAEARGKDMADLIIPQRLRDAHRRGMESYRRSGELQLLGRRLELPALRADGTEFPIALSISVTEVGGKRYLTAFISDLTEQKRANEELARQREALRQNEKLSAMGSMLAGVAHELNNPLAILMGRAALLEAKLTDPTARADIEKIRVAAERCGRIVKTFLGMARQRPADRRLAQLNDIAAGALDLLGYSWRSAGIKVQTDLASDLPQVWIDPDQIGQVVVNLLVNAQQALAEQPEPRLIRIESGRVAEGPNAGVYLRVTDNGPGVPDALHARIFEPFFTTKAEGMGTGVGLAVSRSIMRENGGELRLHEFSRGASFQAWLPLHPQAATPPAMPTCEAPLLADQRPGHALIVDDEREVALLLTDILQSAGFTTTRLSSGREALQWLANGHCDFVLSDIRMPDLDGAGLWRALQDQRPELARRMAFITGDILSPSATLFLKEAGLPWLEKPFTPEHVLALVARVESA